MAEIKAGNDPVDWLIGMLVACVADAIRVAIGLRIVGDARAVVGVVEVAVQILVLEVRRINGRILDCGLLDPEPEGARRQRGQKLQACHCGGPMRRRERCRVRSDAPIHSTTIPRDSDDEVARGPPESPDSPAPRDGLPTSGFNTCAIHIDAADKIYLGFGDSFFGSNAF